MQHVLRGSTTVQICAANDAREAHWFFALFRKTTSYLIFLKRRSLLQSVLIRKRSAKTSLPKLVLKTTMKFLLIRPIGCVSGCLQNSHSQDRLHWGKSHDWMAFQVVTTIWSAS